MTTIAYKDGVIAYDSRACRNGYVEDPDMEKKTTYAGYTFVLAGCLSDRDELMRTLVDGGEGEFACSGLMIDPEGRLWKVGGQDEPWAYKHDLGTHTANGSGSPFALAAMDFGKSAKEAVKYAITRDPNSGGRVRTIKLKRGK